MLAWSLERVSDVRNSFKKALPGRAVSQKNCCASTAMRSRIPVKVPRGLYAFARIEQFRVCVKGRRRVCAEVMEPSGQRDIQQQLLENELGASKPYMTLRALDCVPQVCFVEILA